MRKISLILCFAFVFLLLTPPANIAKATDITPVNFSVASEFLKSVDIPDPAAAKADGQFITRAEALEVFVALLGYHGNSESEVPFTDIKGEITGAAKYALDLKMISASDTFRPNDPITYDEAFKMCVTALGYDYLAKLYGGWNAGYIRMAAETNLSVGLPTEEINITPSAFYLLVENLLTAEMLEVEGVVGDELSYRRYTTVINEYFDMKIIEGIITANEYTGLYDTETKLDEGLLAIDGYRYTYKGNVNAIGRRVKAFVYTDKDEIALAVPFDNVAKTVDFLALNSVSGSSVEYEHGGKTAKLRLESIPAVIYNGKADDSAKIENYIGKNGYFNFIDNDADGTFEVCEINEKTTIVVSGINIANEYIIDKNGERKVDLSHDETHYEIYDGTGEITLSDIKTGSLLSCYISAQADPADSIYCIINVENGSLTGKVTGFSTTGNKIVIDDVEYPYSTYFATHYLTRIKPGNELTFMLSSNGTVEASSEPDYDQIYFGYYMDIAKSTGLDVSLKVKLFTTSNKVEVLPLADKITFDGTVHSKIDDISNKFYNADGSKKLSMQVVRYKVNSDNELTLIDTVSDTKGNLTGTEDVENNLKLYQFPTGAPSLHSTIWYSKTSGMVHPYFAVTANTTIMVVDKSANVDDEDRCVIRDKAWLSLTGNNQFPNANCEAFNIDKYGVAEAMVLYRTTDEVVSDESDGGILYSISKAIDPDGNEAYKLVIYSNTEYKDYYAEEKFVYSDGSGDFLVNKGDYVRFAYDSANYITVIQTDYDMQNDTVNFAFSNQMYLNYYYGKAYSCGNGYFTIMPENMTGITPDPDGLKYSFPVPSEVMIYDKAAGEIIYGSMDDVETYMQVGDSATKLLVVTNDMVVRSVVVYR